MDDVGVTHAVVLKLLEGLEHRGHHIYMDNYYTSPALFQDLRRLGFGACGTVRINRRGIPQAMKSKLQKGEIISEKVDDKIIALKWMDKRPVTMLTTVHDDSVVTKQRRTRAVPGGVEETRKPVVIERYNEFMGGVDLADQLLLYYGFSHRTLKWWWRAFFHLLEVAIVNAGPSEDFARWGSLCDKMDMRMCARKFLATTPPNYHTTPTFSVAERKKP